MTKNTKTILRSLTWVCPEQEVPAPPLAIGEAYKCGRQCKASLECVLLYSGRTECFQILNTQRTPKEMGHLAISNCKNTLQEWNKLAFFSLALKHLQSTCLALSFIYSNGPGKGYCCSCFDMLQPDLCHPPTTAFILEAIHMLFKWAKQKIYKTTTIF